MTAGSMWVSGSSWLWSLAKRTGAANRRTNSSIAFRLTVGICLPFPWEIVSFHCVLWITGEGRGGLLLFSKIQAFIRIAGFLSPGYKFGMSKHNRDCSEVRDSLPLSRCVQLQELYVGCR